MSVIPEGAARTIRVPWRLVFAHLRMSWFRSLLTSGGVALAVFLLATLRTVITELEAGVKYAEHSRVIVGSAVSLFNNLPSGAEQEIRSVPGVRDVTHWTWFGGEYIDSEHMFARFAVDAPSLRRVYGDTAVRPEILLTADEWDNFVEDRRGCIVGASLARQYGFKIGDTIAMKGNIWPAKDEYRFTVRGVYERGSPRIDEASLFFHWKYLDEMSGRRSEMSLFVVDVEEGYDTGRITAEIDGRFESSQNRTRTLTEAAFNQQFISMWGNVPALMSMIGSAVLFAAFMIALNTMLLSVRERRLEVGVLKALGFPDRAIFVLFAAEGIWVCGLGGVTGAFGARYLFNEIGVEALYRFFPAFLITDETVVIAIGAALAIGLVSGIIPAFLAVRLRVIDALARLG